MPYFYGFSGAVVKLIVSCHTNSRQFFKNGTMKSAEVRVHDKLLQLPLLRRFFVTFLAMTHQETFAVNAPVLQIISNWHLALSISANSRQRTRKMVSEIRHCAVLNFKETCNVEFNEKNLKVLNHIWI